MVTVQNTAAIAVYERAGFQIVGTIPNGMCHHGQMSDEYIMVKPIAP
jgi:RimJ/RimL family protein N-acetyltransferase